MAVKVDVVDSNPNWPDEFNSEKLRLKHALGDLIAEIHHIGSTSITGLAAKPVIDIMLEVKSLAALDNKTLAMNSLGYEAKGEFGIVGRRYFIKGGAYKSHQIHAFKTTDANITRHIAFRDYLQSHPMVMKEYANLKKKLASECKDNIDMYCDGKDEFIKFYESKAIKWYANT